MILKQMVQAVRQIDATRKCCEIREKTMAVSAKQGRGLDLQIDPVRRSGTTQLTSVVQTSHKSLVTDVVFIRIPLNDVDALFKLFF